MRIVAIALVSIVSLAFAYLFAAGRYGMSDDRYTCVGQLLPQGGSVAQTLIVRVQQYRWWMRLVRREGVVFVEYPSFNADIEKYVNMYTKVEGSPTLVVFGTGLEGAREGRLSLTDMSLTISNMNGGRFSGICTELAG
jgi:hypothetical protein